MGEWFTTFFDSLVNDFWHAAMPPEATAAEVVYLRRTLAHGRPGWPERNGRP